MTGSPRERVTGPPSRPPAKRRSWMLGLLLVALSTVAGLFQPSSMVWHGSQTACADVAVTVAVKPNCSASIDLLDYRVSAGRSHGPPTDIDAQRKAHQTYYVLAGDRPVLVHNCGGGGGSSGVGLPGDEYDPVRVEGRINGEWAQWRRFEEAADALGRATGRTDRSDWKSGTGTPWEPPEPYDPYKPTTSMPKTKWEKVKHGLGVIVRVIDRLSDLWQ